MMKELPTILFIARIPPDYSPYLAASYGMERSFDLLPHKSAILSLVAWLRENGCEGDYVWVDSPTGENLEIIDKAIDLIKPDALGFSLVTEEIMSHYELIELIKIRHPDIPVIVGGPHATALPEHTLNHFPLIDFAVVGEGERTLTELLHRLAAGQWRRDWDVDLGKLEFTLVKGIAFRGRSGEIVITQPREKIPDINILPDPAFDLIFDANAPPDQRSAFPLVCSYGCYFHCTFCSVEHGNYRSIAPERVVDRIQRAQNDFSAEYFAIRDSFWPPTREWLDKFCDEVERRNLKIKFHFQTRAGTLTDEHMQRLKKLGAQAIAVGVEAGDPEVLKSIKKSITIPMVQKTFSSLNKTGIFSIAFFIFGNKGETRENIQTSIRLAREINGSIAFFHVLYPLPGAEAFDAVPDNQKDWWMGGKLPSICELPVEELENLASVEFLKYPLRWSYLTQHVLGGKLSPEFRNIAKRIFIVHLRKYTLGTAERFAPFRWLIGSVKSILKR